MTESPESLPWLEKCDLYFEWGFDTGFEFIFRDKRAQGSEAPPGPLEESVGLLIEWQAEDGARRGLEVAKALKIFVPGIYAEGSRGSAPGKPRLIWAITVPLASLVRFLSTVAQDIERVELAAPVASRNAGGVTRIKDPSESDVLAVVLDDGCAFANSRFRTSNATRVIWLWNQDANANGAPVTSPNSPSTAANFGYGGQFSSADLDDILASCQGEQDATYRDAGLPGLRRAAAHGTHVMDLLAGAETWEVVFVQFPLAAVDDPSGIWLKHYALDGLLYAIECAGSKTTTIVANISWGPQTGPHNGKSILEKAIEKLVDEQKALPKPRRLVVSVPAGNSFGSRSHARIDHADGGRVDWRVPPDGETPAFVELWWPAGVPLADASLRVTPPHGTPVVVWPGKTIATDGTWWVKLKVVGPSVKALIVVHPTGGFRKGGKAGPHGHWTIEIPPNASGADGSVHVYVARADHNMGARRRAKASYLCDAALEAARHVAPSQRFGEASGSAVRRSGTLNGIATGEHTHTAAGYVFRTFESSPYSSSGPTRQPGGAAKPSYACVTDRSEARPGIRASGVRSGTRAILIGTSTAAPQLGRQLVNNPVLIPHVPSPPRKERVGAGCLLPDVGVVQPQDQSP